MKHVYEEKKQQHRRLTILRCLAVDPHQGVNESILYDMVELHGVPVTRDQVVTETLWLEEQGFLRTVDEEGLNVSYITAAGVLIASGKRQHPGVKTPSVK